MKLPPSPNITWRVCMKLKRDTWSCYEDAHIMGLPNWLQLQAFYNKLTNDIKTLVDATCGESLIGKSIEAHQVELEVNHLND